jgi:hypothetical protein
VWYLHVQMRIRAAFSEERVVVAESAGRGGVQGGIGEREWGERGEVQDSRRKMACASQKSKLPRTRSSFTPSSSTPLTPTANVLPTVAALGRL